MRNIQLIIEYDGSRYDGWHRSLGKVSEGPFRKADHAGYRCTEHCRDPQKTGKVGSVGQRHGNEAVFAYSVMSTSLMIVILLTLLIRAMSYAVLTSGKTAKQAAVLQSSADEG